MLLTLIYPSAELLQQAWGTQLLANPALFGGMVLVALPEGVVGHDVTPAPGFQLSYTYESAEMVQNVLFHEFNIEVSACSPLHCTTVVLIMYECYTLNS